MQSGNQSTSSLIDGAFILKLKKKTGVIGNSEVYFSQGPIHQTDGSEITITKHTFVQRKNTY